MEGSGGEGIIIIKAQLGDDIRCIPVHNVDITFDELVLMMQRIFKGQLTPDDEITIKYKDHDGDLVTISDGNDLTFALQLSQMLRITIFPNHTLRPLANKEIKTLRKELQQVRDLVVKMLDKLEFHEGVQSSAPAAPAVHHNGHSHQVAEDSDSDSSSAAPVSHKEEVRSSSHAREFDPLHSQATSASAAAPVQQHEQTNLSHAPQSVPSMSGNDSGYNHYAYQQQQQQHQPENKPPVQQAPPSQPPQPAQPQAPQGVYYPGYPTSQPYQQGQQQQAPQQQQGVPPPPQQSPYYQATPAGYGQPNQGPPQPGAYGPPPSGIPQNAGGYAAPLAQGYPGQPTPPPGAGGPPPPAQFGAPPPPMMSGPGPAGRGAGLPYGRYQPGYQ